MNPANPVFQYNNWALCGIFRIKVKARVKVRLEYLGFYGIYISFPSSASNLSPPLGFRIDQINVGCFPVVGDMC